MSSTDLNERVNDLLESAINRFMVKDYSETLNELKAALMLDKENPIILYNIGICYCRLGLFNSANKYFNDVLKLSLSFIDSHVVKKVLAYSLIKINDYDSAEKFLTDLQSIIPDDLQVKNMLAYIYEKVRRYKDAIDIYEGIIKKRPDYFGAYNAIAYLTALSDGDLDRAFNFVKKAIKGEAKNPAYYDTAGYILIKLGDYKRAEKFLIEASKLLPFNQEIEAHIRELIIQKGKSET